MRLPGTDIFDVAPLPAEPPPPSEPPPSPAAVHPNLAGELPSEEDAAPGNPLVPWLIAFGAAIFVLAMALLWVALARTSATWEQVHRQDILDMKSEAERLRALGEPDKAYQKFQDLEQLVSGNPINDPDLKAAVQSALKEQEEALNAMLRQTVASVKQVQAPVHATQPTVAPLFAGAPADTSSPSSPAQVIVAAPPPAPTLSRPAAHPVPAPPPIVDDVRIGRAIQAGTQYLLDRFQENRLDNPPVSRDGADALAVYALLQSYRATGDGRLDPRRDYMKLVLDTLKKLPMDDGYATYGRSLRASALALAERPEDLKALQTDLTWLLRTGANGAYSYPMRYYDQQGGTPYYIWDNSNSQYGLLGVWAAAEVGLPVARPYWIAAQKHWISTQEPNGEWSYGMGEDNPVRSMTLAGLASMLVTQDYLRTPTGHDPDPPALTKAMDWIQTGDNSVVSFDEGQLPGYNVFGLERVGLATGYKYFGGHDWYRETAADVLDAARPDGGWGNVISTSYALLFLARGRHPLMMSKLSFDGDWNDRSRDVANLTRYATRQLERQLNWQVVPLDRDWQDWTDCPILYIAAHDAPNLKPADEKKLRDYVLNGGLLVTESVDGSKDFTAWATDLGKRLFSPLAWQPLPRDHPLWTALKRVKNVPHIQEISNGSRLFMLHISDDLSKSWQARAEKDHQYDFDVGLDIFLYATGRTDLRNRLETRAIEPVAEAPAASITMAMLSAAPDSDPEPGAWPRFSRYFRRQTDLGLVLKPLPLESLTINAAQVAHLTGVNEFKATDAQCAALRGFVQSGGVVLIDPCGGPNGFLHAVRSDLLPRAFPSTPLARVGDDHPLLTNKEDGTSQLAPLEVRDYVRGLTTPIDRDVWILRSGKGAVILSSLDITSGLLGTNTWGISGFTPEYSQGLAQNFVLWAWDGARNQ